jgi:hypothetical protein
MAGLELNIPYFAKGDSFAVQGAQVSLFDRTLQNPPGFFYGQGNQDDYRACL